MAKAAFIGLGVMGYPMAGHLVAAGHDTTVWNRTAAQSATWANEHQGAVAASPADAARESDFVFLCVGNDDDVRAVAFGENGAVGEGGALGAMKRGAVLVDHTTASAGLARDLAVAAGELGVGFVDAPVSGGQAGAQNGILTVMCGGEQAQFDAALPMMESYARSVTLMGGSGSGQLTKMVNQICIAGVLQGLSEGLEFARRAGLDIDAVVDTISKGAAGSWQMDNRGTTMARDEFDFGFAVDWMRKDLGICFEEADRNGAPLEVARLVDGYYREIQSSGHNRWDTSSLISRLRDL